MKQTGTIKWVRLGDYINKSEEINSELAFGISSVRGVSNTKGFIKTKADLKGRDLSPFQLVKPRHFAFNRRTTRNGERLGLGYNSSLQTYICTEDYIVFKSKDESVLLADYLYVFILRDEFDRRVRYDSWGSATEFFNWEDMQRLTIPLPPIEVQQELVDTYNGLKSLAEQNEALIEPLSKACEAFIVDCRRKYAMVKLENYILESDKRNSDLSVKLSQGISNMKYFQDPKQVAENSRNDKIVRKGQFAYNRATTRNGEKISIAYRTGEDCTVSSAYGVFYIKDEEVLNPQYLMMWFKRPEFDRYARWRSEGSAHEFFTFEMMNEVEIPLPPIEVQHSIVNIYHCMEEAKSIAAEAREKLKTLCPALIQRAANL